MVHWYKFFQRFYDMSTNRFPAAAKSLQSCPTLCDPIDGSPPGSPIPGILRERTLEWGAISFSNAWKWKVKEVAQLCPTLCNPTDCSLPDSSVMEFSHGIFQARTLEWIAISYPRGSFQARDQIHISCISWIDKRILYD